MPKEVGKGDAMKQSYLYQVRNFAQELRPIRAAFGMETDVKSEIAIYKYNKYLEENPKITSKLEDIMNNDGNKVLFLAQTGSGKTYTFFNTNTNDNVYTFMFTPFKKQCLQNAYKYNVKSVTGGNDISPADFVENRRFSVVYDKADAVISTLQAELLKGHLNDTIINIVVDEVQMLTSAQFRKLALAKLNKLFKVLAKGRQSNDASTIKDNDPDWLKEAIKQANSDKQLNYKYNIIYTTATFNNCALLDFNEVIACHSDSKANIGLVEVVNCGGTVNSKDFVVHNVQKELTKKNKVILRLNNKDVIANLRDLFEQKGYKVEILTSEVKEESSLYESIIHKGQLTTGWDLLLTTSIIDAGVTLDSFEDGTTPKNIVPMFLLDALNNNLDDCKQFSNRIRFEYDRFKILVDKCEQPEEKEVFTGFAHAQRDEKFVSLEDLAKAKAKNYITYKTNYENIANGLNNIYKDRDKTTKIIQQILDEKDYFGRKNDFGGLFSVFNGKVLFNHSDAWNRIYSEYMQQMLKFKVNRMSYIDVMFNCPVVETTVWEDDIKEQYTNYTQIKFDVFIDKAKKDESIRTKIFKKEYDQIDGIDDIKRDKRFEKFKRIIELTDSIDVAISDMLDETSTQKINKKIRAYEKEIISKFNKEQVKNLELYLKTKNDKILDEDTTKVLRGDYNEIFEDFKRLKVNLNTALELIKTKEINQVQEWLREEQTIINNKKIENGEKLRGRSGVLQETLIFLVNSQRGPVSTITFDQRDLEMLAQKMTYLTKTKFSAQSIKKALCLTYTYNTRTKDVKAKKNKEDFITVKDLRKNHKK